MIEPLARARAGKLGIQEDPKDGPGAWAQMRFMADALFLRKYDEEYLVEMKGIADGSVDPKILRKLGELCRQRGVSNGRPAHHADDQLLRHHAAQRCAERHVRCKVVITRHWPNRIGVMIPL